MLLQVIIIPASALSLYVRLNSTKTTTASMAAALARRGGPPSRVQLARPTPEGQEQRVLPLSLKGCR